LLMVKQRGQFFEGLARCGNNRRLLLNADQERRGRDQAAEHPGARRIGALARKKRRRRKDGRTRAAAPARARLSRPGISPPGNPPWSAVRATPTDEPRDFFPPRF